MSLSVERYDDVTRLRMANLGSRAFRLDVSAYVVRGVMIDSGFPHVCEQLLRAVDSIGINGCIVTHSHEDHAGNAAPLAHRGVSLLATEETVRVLRARPAIALYRRIASGSSARSHERARVVRSRRTAMRAHAGTLRGSSGRMGPVDTDDLLG